MSGSDVVLGPVEVTETPPDTSGEGDSGSSGGSFGSGFVGLVDTSNFAAEPLIDEPAASGGDSALWVEGQMEDPDEKCPPDDQNCEDRP